MSRPSSIVSGKFGHRLSTRYGAPCAPNPRIFATSATMPILLECASPAQTPRRQQPWLLLRRLRLVSVQWGPMAGD